MWEHQGMLGDNLSVVPEAGTVSLPSERRLVNKRVYSNGEKRACFFLYILPIPLLLHPLPSFLRLSRLINE